MRPDKVSKISMVRIVGMDVDDSVAAFVTLTDVQTNALIDLLSVAQETDDKIDDFEIEKLSRITPVPYAAFVRGLREHGLLPPVEGEHCE